MIVVGLVAGATTQGADREFIIWGVLIAYFGIQALGALYLAYLAGIQRFDAIAKLNILSTLLLVCSVGWGAYSWGLVGVLCGYLAGGILPAGIGLYTFIRSLKNAQVSADLSKRVTRYAIYTWFTAIVAFFVWSRAEILFLKFFWNDRLVAMFTVSLGLVSLITQGQSLLSGALLPHFVNKADSDNKLAIENTFVLTTRIFAFLFFPACLGIAAILPWLLPMLYGEAFRDAVPFSMALVAATGFTAVGAPASIMIFAMEKPKFHFVSNAVSAFLILAFSTITIGHWGLTGAVAQRLVVQVSLVFLSFFYIARRLRIDVPWRSIFIILISSIVGLLPLFVFSHYFNPIGSVFMGVALFLLLYMFMLYLFGAISQDDWKFFRQTYLHEIGFPKRRAS
jgi:O-antigen/teichoic acid export membrane protein